MKKIQKFTTALIIFLALLLAGNKKIFFDYFARPLKRNLFSISGRLRFLSSSCSLPLVKKIPKESTVLIGHA